MDPPPTFSPAVNVGEGSLTAVASGGVADFHTASMEDSVGWHRSAAEQGVDAPQSSCFVAWSPGGHLPVTKSG